jgi:hypothetical protein
MEGVVRIAHRKWSSFVALVALLAALVEGLPDPIAAADENIPLGGGAGIAVNGDLCTLTTIGHDRSGQLVGFTSAHCAEIVSINAIIADATAKGGPGAGFVPVPA